MWQEANLDALLLPACASVAVYPDLQMQVSQLISQSVSPVSPSSQSVSQSVQFQSVSQSVQSVSQSVDQSEGSIPMATADFIRSESVSQSVDNSLSRFRSDDEHFHVHRPVQSARLPERRSARHKSAATGRG